MKTVRRLFYRDIVSAVAFVALAFLSLFFFIDFVDELGGVSASGYSLLVVMASSLLLLWWREQGNRRFGWRRRLTPVVASA